MKASLRFEDDFGKGNTQRLGEIVTLDWLFDQIRTRLANRAPEETQVIVYLSYPDPNPKPQRFIDVFFQDGDGREALFQNEHGESATSWEDAAKLVRIAESSRGYKILRICERK